MLLRRTCLLASAAALAGCASPEVEAKPQAAAPITPQPAPSAPPPKHFAAFDSFVADVSAQARREGISPTTLKAAFAGLHPNQRVIEMDRHQPEFTQSWAQYRAARLSEVRVNNGRAAFRRNRAAVLAASDRYGIPPSILMGIWGLESNYGTTTGGFGVVEALATLAWEGRRAAYFRTELLASLRILEHGDISAPRMTGSYAGAMGQPQFMPSSYMSYAVDMDGDGRRDIWTSTPDVLGSMANYLARSGWKAGQGWGIEVRAPAGLDASLLGRTPSRSLAEWQRLGVRPIEGGTLPARDQPAGLVMPDGTAGDGFLVFSNFAAIRRYNPSDYYALAVALLGEQVAV